MRVRLIYHLELVESGEGVWWAESPDVPGFFGTDLHLWALQTKAQETLREALSEEAGEIAFDHALVDDIANRAPHRAPVESIETSGDLARVA